LRWVSHLDAFSGYLKSQYKTNKEIVSNMAFYLRPLNMIKNVIYVNGEHLT